MENDIATVYNREEILNFPINYRPMAEKNQLLHKKDISTAISGVTKSQSRGDWYIAGVDAGTVATLLLDDSFPVSDILPFVAGFLFRFVGDNKLTHIQECEHDGITIGKDISKAIKDF